MLDQNETYSVGDSLTTFYGNLTILNVTDSQVVVDVRSLNHSLAGKTLVFNITLVSIGQEESQN
jgi:FKBP-type peptidyl-prolyl cis-trans isomerase 2